MNWLRIGALFAMTGVMLGAFGAHLLKDSLAQSGHTDTFETAVRYQMYHALALCGIGLHAWMAASRADDAPIRTNSRLRLAGVAMTAGILLFSGSLFVLSLSGIRWLGAITPFGGGLMILGWALWLSCMSTSGSTATPKQTDREHA